INEEIHRVTLAFCSGRHDAKPRSIQQPAANLTRASCRLQRMQLRGIGLEPARSDRLANLPHQTLVEIQVMNGVQVSAQYFAALIQMPQIAATVVTTGVTATSLFDRTGVLLMRRIAYVEGAAAGE